MKEIHSYINVALTLMWQVLYKLNVRTHFFYFFKETKAKIVRGQVTANASKPANI